MQMKESCGGPSTNSSPPDEILAAFHVRDAGQVRFWGIGASGTSKPAGGLSENEGRDCGAAELQEVALEHALRVEADVGAVHEQ